MKRFFLLLLLIPFFYNASAQEIEEDQLGAWYMYFFNKKFGDSRFGIQGDYQFRYWNAGSDLEQILLRTGVTYSPENANVLFTLGYGNITTGQFGDSDETVNESRIYQEALLPHKVGERFLLTHRFRYEQRWVESQDFRTRYRYNIFLNVPFNDTALGKGVVYLALYNEIFINGQRDIGEGRTVEFFDRNRTYTGLGFGLRDNLRVQAGWMKQTTANWSKGQAQLSLHHSF
ncbi:DUF2490 domain-containing protein [Fulvivirga sp. RKSG066]|uniref:DUF2490 domain-containing protein n=1 Tax=Fulvivirga aurantia TaxID=2529383 RepID=UPI0012BC6184|nr:DUF2490 domain-containing protein [Fulvivirga aurantia]MTI21686.1 DUF2490 domain-containing protein [Fulvivirga aurantia]